MKYLNFILAITLSITLILSVSSKTFDSLGGGKQKRYKKWRLTQWVKKISKKKPKKSSNTQTNLL